MPDNLDPDSENVKSNVDRVFEAINTADTIAVEVSIKRSHATTNETAQSVTVTISVDPKCPRKGTGVEPWLNSVTVSLLRKNLVFEIVRNLTHGCGGEEAEIEAEIKRSIQTAQEHLGIGEGVNVPKVIVRRTPKWPKADPIKIAEALAKVGDYRVEDLREQSPVQDPRQLTASKILGQLFPARSLVCCATTEKDLGTILPVESWLVSPKLSTYQFIIPAKMKEIFAMAENGEIIRNEQGTAKRRLKTNIEQTRRFLMTEWDRELADKKQLEDFRDEQAALIVRLSFIGKLILIVSSAGKSLQSWWNIASIPEWKIKQFFRYACELGADGNKYSINGLVRLPGGWRPYTQKAYGKIGGRQEVLYFDPEAI